MKRLGAMTVTVSASTWHLSGLIQVRNCCGGNSFSSAARQRRQKLFIGTVLELEFGAVVTTEKARLFAAQILPFSGAVIHSRRAQRNAVLERWPTRPRCYRI